MKQPQLGDYIANLRKEQGLTQEELVELCNINVRTIQRIEAGDVTPRNYTIKNILRALGSSFEDVLTSKKAVEASNSCSITLLKKPKLGLNSGILGIIYIVISIPYFIVDIAFFTNEVQMVSGGFMFLIGIAYLIAIIAFYVSLIPALNVQKSNLLKYCVSAFLALQVISTSIGCYLYQVGLDGSSNFIFILALTSLIFYGVSYLVIALPFIMARNEFKTLFSLLGWFALAGGLFHITIALFPIGMIGVLAFEITLIILLIRASYIEKQEAD